MKRNEYCTRLMRAIDYVENNLNKKIELIDISHYAFSSLSHFHRIFYFMTGYTLKDYIRSRRLSNAAIKLIQTKENIIDIAYEAQFETPESFNKAFKNYYHLSPSEFRKKKPELKIVKRLEINPIEFKMPENISLEYMYLQEQIVLGYKTKTTLENDQQTIDIPIFFGKIINDNLLSLLPNVIDRQGIVGVYSDTSNEEEFDFTLGLFVDKIPEKNQLWIHHILPMGEYARFRVQGPPNQLAKAWRYIYGSWMPISGRSRRDGFDFEIYYPGKIDIYIPMLKV